MLTVDLWLVVFDPMIFTSAYSLEDCVGGFSYKNSYVLHFISFFHFHILKEKVRSNEFWAKKVEHLFTPFRCFLIQICKLSIWIHKVEFIISKKTNMVKKKYEIIFHTNERLYTRSNNIITHSMLSTFLNHNFF